MWLDIQGWNLKSGTNRFGLQWGRVLGFHYGSRVIITLKEIALSTEDSPWLNFKLFRKCGSTINKLRQAAITESFDATWALLSYVIRDPSLQFNARWFVANAMNRKKGLPAEAHLYGVRTNQKGGKNELEKHWKEDREMDILFEHNCCGSNNSLRSVSLASCSK